MQHPSSGASAEFDTGPEKRAVFSETNFARPLARNVLFSHETGSVTARTLPVVLVAGASFNRGRHRFFSSCAAFSPPVRPSTEHGTRNTGRGVTQPVLHVVRHPIGQEIRTAGDGGAVDLTDGGTRQQQSLDCWLSLINGCGVAITEGRHHQRVVDEADVRCVDK